MRFPDVHYLRWAKALPPADANLARSGLDPCPPALLGLRAADLATSLPVRDGYRPLVEAIANRYRVAPTRVFTVPGGTSLANFMACAAVLNDAPRGSEIIVEHPAYEPLVRVPQALGQRVRRFRRRFADGFAIDLDRFAAMITPRTRLAIVSNLHNPSGIATDLRVLRAMARLLARVGGHLLVDEVYLECLWGERTASCVHAGPNVIATNSLTKAYGLDGLRAGWLLGPAAVVARAARIQDLMANNGVAPGEQMALAAFRRLPAIRARAQAILGPNLARMWRFLAEETRVRGHLPHGGSVCFVQLPGRLDGDRFANYLRRKHSTLVVPGRFFEMPGFVRLSFGMAPEGLDKGLGNVSRALDDLAP